MTAADVIAALELPRTARVDQRIAKKLLVENGAVTAADKRRINEGIEELTWVAALKPTTIGVPAYRDDVREYLEIAVLSLVLRPMAKPPRLVELVHRAIPYPVLLIDANSERLALSVAHKRHAQNEAGKVVLDEGVVAAEVKNADSANVLPPLGLATLPKVHMLAVYQGWLERIEALAAAWITGCCLVATDGTAAKARREALAACARLNREIANLRAQAERASQISQRVELNLEIKRLETALAEAKSQL